jgi:hypothetical protein
MAPIDKIHLPFRWQFIPSEDPRDRSVRWSWRAYTHTGAVAMESKTTFETLTECMSDARASGYGQ